MALQDHTIHSGMPASTLQVSFATLQTLVGYAVRRTSQ
jgi:hypothetical protein